MAKRNANPKGKKTASSPDPTVAPGHDAVDNAAADAVVSNEQGAKPEQGHAPDFGGERAAPNARSMKMAELKLVLSKADRKSKRLVNYNIEGRTGSVQFLSTLFGGDQKSQGNPPETMTLVGEFAEPKTPKAKETPEERKARLAALPKLTLAEKVARAEERAAKLREKLAKDAAKATEGAAAPAQPQA